MFDIQDIWEIDDRMGPAIEFTISFSILYSEAFGERECFHILIYLYF